MSAKLRIILVRSELRRSPWQDVCGTKARPVIANLDASSPLQVQPSREFSSPAQTDLPRSPAVATLQALSAVCSPHLAVNSDDAACHRVTGVFGVVDGPLSLTLILPKREAITGDKTTPRPLPLSSEQT